MEEHLRCPICLDVVAHARIASCGHLYCGGCYYDMASRLAPTPRCAVCREALDARPVPGFFVDALAASDSPAYAERLRASKGRTALAESRLVAMAGSLRDSTGHLGSLDVGVRTWALARTLLLCEACDIITCAEFGTTALRDLAWCGTSRESAEEMELAWRIMAHCAAYCPDAGRLVAARVHWAAAEALVSSRRTPSITRHATACVAALVPAQHAHFRMFFEPKWMEPLAGRAPAALAHAALHTPGGLASVATAGLLASVVLRIVGTHRTLAMEVVYAMLEHPACAGEARALAGAMLQTPLQCAHALAAVAWRDADVAGIIWRLHPQAVRDAAAAAAALPAEDMDARLAVLDLLSALLGQANMLEPSLVVFVLRWMRDPLAPPALHTYGYSFVSSSARKCGACARAVCGEYLPLALMVDADNESTLYMAGDVFSHEHLAVAHARALTDIVRDLMFDSFAAVYFASALAGTAAGAGVLDAYSSFIRYR